MATVKVLLLLPFLSLQWLLISGSPSTSTNHQIPKHYVVYMGAPKSSSNNGNEAADAKVDDKLAHLELLSSVVPSEEKERISLIHHYHHAFRGFSAMLTENEASRLSSHGDVISVIEDEIVELQTTRSWDFIEAGMQSKWGLDKPISKNMTIGIIDSGIWPESPSFNDKGFGPIPSNWKGACSISADFNKSNCNRKLIGAKYFLPLTVSDEWTPRDLQGHGTHVAAIAAGSVVAGASYMGLGNGTARGGVPSARIASYKVCSSGGCSTADQMKGIDEALKDGVDIISISIGYKTRSPDYLNDPIAIAAFHAEQSGVLVVLSAGNRGPKPYTVGHTAPWMFTVAASTIDRHFGRTGEIPRDYKPAPVVADFSSRGPGEHTENILKPDIMAPGEAILSAARSSTEFQFKSGTSMACPHVSGAAAFIKSVHPTWTPSMIKSALMTTATANDNTGKPLTNTFNRAANAHEAGVGELNHMKAVDPGLVFETTIQDYFNFLCYYGYPQWRIRAAVKNTTLQCPYNSYDKELITDINYPSISIGELYPQLSTPRVVKRTVTNVGPSSSTYTAQVYNPTTGLVVKVNPNRIVFSNGLKRVPFEVSFDGNGATMGYHFGHITWSDVIIIPFVLCMLSMLFNFP